MMTLEYRAETPDDTAALGRQLGAGLFAGAVVALVGPLGAGKTFLVRAISEGLGTPDPRMVTSPTFVLIQEYPGRLPIYHFDAYRLPDPEAFRALGIEEYLAGGGVCLIEWADRVKEVLPDERLGVELFPSGEQSRRIVLRANGTAYEQLLKSLPWASGPADQTAVR